MNGVIWLIVSAPALTMADTDLSYLLMLVMLRAFPDGYDRRQDISMRAEKYQIGALISSHFVLLILYSRAVGIQRMWCRIRIDESAVTISHRT